MSSTTADKLVEEAQELIEQSRKSMFLRELAQALKEIEHRQDALDAAFNYKAELLKAYESGISETELNKFFHSKRPYRD